MLQKTTLKFGGTVLSLRDINPLHMAAESRSIILEFWWFLVDFCSLAKTK
jgi:hypothetical protein